MRKEIQKKLKTHSLIIIIRKENCKGYRVYELKCTRGEDKANTNIMLRETAVKERKITICETA